MVDNSNLQFNSYALQNGNIPKAQEGQRGIPLTLDFTAQTAWLLDLKVAQAQAHVSYIQTIYIDNSQNTATLSVSAGTNGQVITIPPKSQAYLPILAVTPPVLRVSTAGGVFIPLQLLNFPVTPCVWNCTNPVMTINADGSVSTEDFKLGPLVGNWNGFGNSLAVADLGLQTLIASPSGSAGLNVNVISGGGGGGNIYTGINGVLNSGLASLNLYTPTVGQKFVVNDLSVYADPDANITTGGFLNVRIADDVTADMFIVRVWLPGAAAAPTIPTGGVPLFSMNDMNWKSSTANNKLKVTTSAAINGSGGGIRVVATVRSEA